MIHVEEINDPYELSSFRLLWNSLLPQTSNATFFQSLEWLEIFGKHLGGGRLRVLVICSDARPVGILPLVVRTESTRLGPIRVLTYPLHERGTFYGPIGPNPTATLTAGLRHIRRTRRDWDLLDLRWIDLDGSDRGRTEKAMQRAGFDPRKQAWDRAAMIDLHGTWSEYWRSRAKKWQHTVRHLARRLGEEGKVTLLRYRPAGSAEGGGDPRWDLYKACTKIADSGRQSSSADGNTLSYPHDCSYLRHIHVAAARTGSLDLNLLLLDGRPIAFACNYCFQGRVCAARNGFEPEFSALKPGIVLTQMMLRDGFDRQDSCYDMGVGFSGTEQHWQTSIVTSYRYTHFPIFVPRAQLLRMTRWLQDRIHGKEYVACAQTA